MTKVTRLMRRLVLLVCTTIAFKATSLVAQSTEVCAPNCNDINLSIQSEQSGEYHSKVFWDEVIPNYRCTGTIAYSLTTKSGAPVQSGSSDDVGNEQYFIISNPCSYVSETLVLTVSNALGSCASEVTFKPAPINLIGQRLDVYCDDPRVHRPMETDVPPGYYACDGTLDLTWVTDWITHYECEPLVQDTAKVILREWETFDKSGERFTVFDTVIVHQLPSIDSDHVFCAPNDTMYCGTEMLAGPYLIKETFPGSGVCDTLPFLEINTGAEGLAIDLVLEDALCGLLTHVDVSSFNEGCEKMYRIALEVKQDCGGLTNSAPCLVPDNNAFEEIGLGYWRCEYWLTVLDTTAPVMSCDYSHFDDLDIVEHESVKSAGHCLETPASPGSAEWAPILLTNVSPHDCEATTALPSICVYDSCSGVKNVKASISGVGSFSLERSEACGGGHLFSYSGVVQLAMRDAPYQILYEAMDECHNVDSIYCYIVPKDRERPVVVTDKQVNVSLSDKLVWVDADVFDEGSYDGCEVQTLLARRTDWSTGIDICNDVDTLCTYHDQAIIQGTIADGEFNEIAAHYSKTIEWLESDESACSQLLINGWKFGLIAAATQTCRNSTMSEEELIHILSSDEAGCMNVFEPVRKHPGCLNRMSEDQMILEASQIGGGWSDQVPFTCEDACKIVTVEILAIDYWCNWSKNWTKVLVEDKSPVSVVSDLTENVEISCKSYRDLRFEDASGHPQSLESIVGKAMEGDIRSLDQLNEVLGGYDKVWSGAHGEYIDQLGNAVDPYLIFEDSMCQCYEEVIKVEVIDDHLGSYYKDSTVNVCKYQLIPEQLTRGLVKVNCGTNMHCEQTVWADVDHCGEGDVYRKFKIWQGCSVGDESSSHSPDTIIRIQKISIGNQCKISPAMFDLPDDITVHSCGVEYSQDGSTQVVGTADTSKTGSPFYHFDDDCRLIAIGYEDKVFKIVGGDEACFKIVREWYMTDICSSVSESLGDFWWRRGDHEMIVHTQQILVVDTVAPECVVTGPVPDGGVINANGSCTFDFTATVDLNDACGIISYTHRLYEEGGTHIIGEESGSLPAVGQALVDVSYPGLPAGSYQLRVRLTDDCQNESYCTYSFTIQDGKKPTPICISTLTVDLVPHDADGDGSMDTSLAKIWAQQFDASSQPPCGYKYEELKFYIELQRSNIEDFNSLDTAVDMNYVEVGCSDVGARQAKLWILAPNGAFDYCLVTLSIRHSDGDCHDLQDSTATMAPLRGNIITSDAFAIEGVVVDGLLTETGEVMRDVTDTEGSFSLPMSVGQSIELTPKREGDDLNGITTQDLLVIVNHVSGSEVLENGFQRIAADIDVNRVIETKDILDLRNLILGNDSLLSGGHSWRFVPDVHIFSTDEPETEEFPEHLLAQFDDTTEKANFIGIKVGDLNLDRTTRTSRSGSSTEMRVSDLIFSPDDPVTVSPKLREVQSMVKGMQLEIRFDVTALRFEQLDWNENSGLTSQDIGLRDVEDGVIYVSYVDIYGGGLDLTKPLFNLRFRAIEHGRLSNAIALGSQRLASELYPNKNEVIPVSLAFEAEESGLKVHQNVPNPFTERTTVLVEIAEEDKLTITILDVNGKSIWSQTKFLEKGRHSIALDRKWLSGRGVYYYQVRTTYDVQTKKMALFQ